MLIGAAGYIGSRLSLELSRRGFAIVGCDIRPSLNPENFVEYHEHRYQDLDDQSLMRCDAFLWFAGHSSVKMAQQQPYEAIENNVFDLSRLFHRVGKLGKWIIYASSASVLSSSDDQYSHVATEVSSNSYDASKLAFDIVTPHLGVHCVGLRMATVSGWSPNMRWDLVFNAMNASARKNGVVVVQNNSAFRSVLFIEDLCAYLVDKLQDHVSPGIYSAASQIGLASWSGTIGTLGAEISDYWNVPLEFEANSGTYSFFLSDRELSRLPALGNSVYSSIRRRCELFASQMGWGIEKDADMLSVFK
ncbi:NAD-dependent epimerase/dehydratase family protein [Methylobacterium sp. E-066]|uniref:NAD-dependent epimerase/dehydratase family protein n=1 Tax=Methylobacterium sp. E-066 TaxID=2836584 RepID=UPI001FB9A79D|nr:NAD-dependent epimerase/dehydratase family protein [Methylobacterium sp. E-066]MCJ2143454.1 NAD-dependent epimerase/dehydratase family protein [Methylobacterium sp. E-066]